MSRNKKDPTKVVRIPVVIDTAVQEIKNYANKKETITIQIVLNKGEVQSTNII